MRNGVTQIDTDYPFFMIDNAMDLQDGERKFPHEGILGLSPDVDKNDYLTLGVPMPVHLFKRKRIERALIALDMKKTGQSTIQIGKYDKGRFRYIEEQIKDLAWVKVNNTDDLKWRALMSNVYYNRSEFAGIYIDDKTVVDDGFKNIAVFDSFYPGIQLPVLEWTRLYQFEQAQLLKKNITLKCNF